MATNEEFERKMSFIVEQQAQFASDIQQLRESQTETNQVVAQTGEIVARLAYATLEGFKEVNVKIDALVDAQIRTDEHLNRTDEQLRQTDEQLRQTDEQLLRTSEQQRLTDEQLRRTSEQQRLTDEQIRRTNENVGRTDAALQSLIGVVQQHLSEGSHGV
jgi:hypothetical protein